MILDDEPFGRRIDGERRDRGGYEKSGYSHPNILIHAGTRSGLT